MAGSQSRIGALLFLAATPLLLGSGCGVFSDPVQEQWQSRDEYSGCGDVELTQGHQIKTQAKEQIECMRSALEAGESAELKVTAPTVEGDPVRTYYRLTPKGALEVYVDSTDDSFGSQDWSFTECDTATWLPGVSCP